MCLLAFSWNDHPRYALIFAGNRDEFHARPTAAAGWWPDSPNVFGGRDLEAGGTWLGLRRDARFAVVTNFREPDRRPAGKRTRGELATRFLAGTMTSLEYLERLHAHADDYAGFNLVFGDINDQLYYFSNRADDALPLPGGVHALSNHLLNTPWPKVRKLEERFEKEAARDEPRVDALLDFLDDREPADDDDLPSTGLARDWERRLSAAKVTGAEYGTRSSTVILVDRNGECVFHERRFDVSGENGGDAHVNFGPA